MITTYKQMWCALLLCMMCSFALFINQITIAASWHGIEKGIYWMVDYEYYDALAWVENETNNWIQVDSN